MLKLIDRIKTKRFLNTLEPRFEYILMPADNYGDYFIMCMKKHEFFALLKFNVEPHGEEDGLLDHFSLYQNGDFFEWTAVVTISPESLTELYECDTPEDARGLACYW